MWFLNDGSEETSSNTKKETEEHIFTERCNVHTSRGRICPTCFITSKNWNKFFKVVIIISYNRRFVLYKNSGVVLKSKFLWILNMKAPSTTYIYYKPRAFLLLIKISMRIYLCSIPWWIFRYVLWYESCVSMDGWMIDSYLLVCAETLSCIFQLSSATEDTEVESSSAICLRPGSGDYHVL